jgi:hypothetical protein
MCRRSGKGGEAVADEVKAVHPQIRKGIYVAVVREEHMADLRELV